MAKGKSSAGGGGGGGRKPKHSNDANRSNAKGAKGQRDAATVRRLKMYKTRAVRDKKGKIIHEDLQSKDLPTTRIQPDRRWFGNTRVIGQQQLESFRTEMASKVSDAYTVLLREKKLPLQLLQDPEAKQGAKQARSELLTAQPFAATFGPGRSRKRPKLAAEGYEGMLAAAAASEQRFEAVASAAEPQGEFGEFKDAAKDAIFEKGQSKRIWGELYKVLDSSDVVIQVLDARDPEGTRCRFIEQHIRRNARHKHLLLLLNKCDLVPAWVTKRWLHSLSREFPTLAFHASITNPFGKGALLSLLRQLARLRSDKQAISVGFIGYPNVGKSSVINALRTKKVCKTAPVPGETKVWQYITLMKRIFLIDCPGVVYHRTHDSESDAVLKGVVRVEGLEDATQHVAPVLERVKPQYLRRAYRIKSWTDAEDFLEQLARASGKLLKGGDPDLNTAARMVLYDWQRGKIPFYTLPPGYTDAPPGADGGAADAPGAPQQQQDEEGQEQQQAQQQQQEAQQQQQQQHEDGEQQPQPGGGGMFTQAVTAEDAAAEAGARPESAAAAAAALRDAAASVLRRQRRATIPIREGYYLPDDEQGGSDGSEEGGSEGGSEDSGSELSGDDSSDGDDDASPGSGEEGEEDAGGDAAEGSDGSGSGSDGEAAGSEEDGGAGAAAAADQRSRKRRRQDVPAQQQPGGRRGKAAAAAAAAAEDGGGGSGDESDGYGEAGLSWEAVLQAVQGGGGEALPTTAAAADDDDDAAGGPRQPAAAAEQPPAAAGKQRRARAAAAGAGRSGGGRQGKKQKAGARKTQQQHMDGLQTLD